MVDHWGLIENVFNRVCEAYVKGRLLPLLEADVTGYVYYGLVEVFGGDAKRVHLSTRLAGAPGNDKYDLIIGDVLGTDSLKELLLRRAGDELDEITRKLIALKSVRAGFRPAVRGEIILEFKHFAEGFDPQQLRVHAQQAIDDVRKLVKVAKVCPKGRGVVLFDEKGYINNVRQQEIISAREGDSSLRIYLFRRTSARGMAWSLC